MLQPVNHLKDTIVIYAHVYSIYPYICPISSVLCDNSNNMVLKNQLFYLVLFESFCKRSLELGLSQIVLIILALGPHAKFILKLLFIK